MSYASVAFKRRAAQNPSRSAAIYRSRAWGGGAAGGRRGGDWPAPALGGNRAPPMDYRFPSAPLRAPGARLQASAPRPHNRVPASAPKSHHASPLNHPPNPPRHCKPLRPASPPKTRRKVVPYKPCRQKQSPDSRPSCRLSNFVSAFALRKTNVHLDHVHNKHRLRATQSARATTQGTHPTECPLPLVWPTRHLSQQWQHRGVPSCNHD